MGASPTGVGKRQVWSGAPPGSGPERAAVDRAQQRPRVLVDRDGSGRFQVGARMPPRRATQGTPAFAAALTSRTVSPTTTARPTGTPARSRACSTRSGEGLLAGTSSALVASTMTSSASGADRRAASSPASAEVANATRRPRAATARRRSAAASSGSGGPEYVPYRALCVPLIPRHGDGRRCRPAGDRGACRGPCRSHGGSPPSAHDDPPAGTPPTRPRRAGNRCRPACRPCRTERHGHSCRLSLVRRLRRPGLPGLPSSLRRPLPRTSSAAGPGHRQRP